MKWYQRWLALTFCLSAAMAGEAPIQPQLLPMEQLLKTLDQAQEWMLVPLADYRALMKASAVKEPLDRGLRGARIATAQITGTLSDDRVLALHGSLVVNSHGLGPGCRSLVEQGQQRSADSGPPGNQPGRPARDEGGQGDSHRTRRSLLPRRSCQPPDGQGLHRRLRLADRRL